MEIFADRKRGAGITTALIDIAIANARTGATVQFWTKTDKLAEKAFEIAKSRIEVSDNLSGIEIQYNKIIYRMVGSVCFQKLSHSTSYIGFPGTDFDILDYGFSGTVYRYES